MSERTPDEKLNELIGLLQAMDEGGAPPPLLGVLVGETHAALTELLALRKDQADWRKGVGLIASALGENKPADLCCVRIANVALALRAEVERLRSVAALVTILQKDTGTILADNERLRAVEQAARALKQWASTQPICPACKAEVTFTGWYGHHPHCRLRQLHYALSATKQEPEKL